MISRNTFAAAAGLIIVFGTVASAYPDAPLRCSIADAARQMKRPHEARPYGVPKSYNWYAHPVIEAGNRPPTGFRAFTAWGQLFRVDGTAPVSLDISIRNLRAYVVLPSGKAELVQSSSSLDGADFRTDYRNNENVGAEIGRDREGGTTVRTDPFAAFHFWPSSGKVAFEPRAVRGIVVAVEAKINPGRGQTAADVDRQLIMSVGADYWATRTSQWDNYRTNIGVAMGRFEYLTTEWKCFTMTTVSDKDAPVLSAQILC